MTQTRTPCLLQFWTNLTPVKRAILATIAETHYNKTAPTFMEDVGERIKRVTEASESSSIDMLTTNVCDHIERQLVKQGAEATLETVIKGLLGK